MKKILPITLTIVLLVSLFALPTETSAKTVAEFEAEVKKYTNELEAKKNNLAKNETEVAQIRKRISQIQGQITAAEQEIEDLEAEIEESNKEIKRKGEQSKNIFAYYQIANGENLYLEYIFGATSITDMVYRMSIVEQLTEYNDKIMKELEELVKKNEARKKELNEKNAELRNLEASLEREKARIEADSASLRESMPSIENQIKEAKANVTYFKNLGCGSNEDILACQYRVAQASGSSFPSVGTFARPMAQGYVTQYYKGLSHMGYDLSSYNKSEPVYPVAGGIVHSIYTDNCTGSYFCQSWGISCNGNAKIVVIKHNYNNRYIYSSYVHLGSYGNISVGQYVTRDTVIGYMGNTGCSTGAHLHIEMSGCFWSNNGGCTYAGYQKQLIDPGSLINFPSRWNNR